ncbi:MAG TPA: response regulator transcription factor [Fimbriimonadaceae bacterium]|jgi:two-component system response regulator MprA
MMTPILVVEDEPALLPVLRQALTESGYQVATAVTGREGADALCQKKFLLGIVDLMLPGLSGFEIIRKVRDEGVTTPILVLSARGGLDDKVKALDLGADDYLAKPFKTAELLARIRALLRRAGPSASLLVCGDLTIDPETREVERAGYPLVLSQTEYAMLELLVKNMGKPLSKASLLHKVWKGKTFDSDNIVEVYIGYLRQKTEEGGRPRMIQTVRGQGYAIVGTAVD